MASRNFAQLVCRLSLLSFRRGASSEIRYEMCFRCLEQMQKIMSFVKLFIYGPCGGNIFRVSIDRQLEMKIVTVAKIVGGPGMVQEYCLWWEA